MSEDVIGHEEEGRALVAEYVLGLLGARDHRRVAQKIADDPAWAAEERRWQARFSGLDEEFGETPAPAKTFAALEQRLFADAQKPASWFESLSLWRGLAGAATAVAVVAIGLNLVDPPAPSSGDLATQLVAALEAEGTDVRYLALYDSQTGAVRLTGLSGTAGAGRDFELWAIQGENAPVSMGVIEAGTRLSVPLEPALAAQWGAGSVLAISLEPQGGSPTGAPTGPVVASGAVTAI